MELLVRIHQGNILVSSPRGGDSDRFDDERAAAAHVAYKTVQKSRRRTYDVSCDFPALNGRPGFSKAAFEALLSVEVTRLRGSMSSLAA